MKRFEFSRAGFSEKMTFGQRTKGGGGEAMVGSGFMGRVPQAASTASAQALGQGHD